MTTQNTNYSSHRSRQGAGRATAPHAPGALPAPPERCPYCRRTSGVQPIAGTSPKVQAWSCTCGTNWAITSTPRPAYLVDLCAAVEEIGRLRWALAQVVTLADEMPKLTDGELRTRLLALAKREA
jgi:hypothetical protein